MVNYCSKTPLHDGIDGVEILDSGECNLYSNARWRQVNEQYSGPNQKEILEGLIGRIKSKKKPGNKYDCLIGLSGGVDSSYVALKLREFGCNPLALHVDNGWNSETSVANIMNIVNVLSIDLKTIVLDWREVRDLQLAYLKSSVLDLECVSDHAINASLFKIAREQNIKYIVHGGNVATESIMPKSWAYDKRDAINLKAIHKAHGIIKLQDFPLLHPSTFFVDVFFRQIKAVPLLNYIDYVKPTAIVELKNKLGWKSYGNKHCENHFTKFFQEVFLPEKFGIDKRLAHFSSLIVSGQMTREEALDELSRPILSVKEIIEIKSYVAKKLGITLETLNSYIAKPAVKHTHFSNIGGLLDHSNPLLQFARYFAKGEMSKKNLQKIMLAARKQH